MSPTTLLMKFKDVVPDETPLGLPPNPFQYYEDESDEVAQELMTSLFPTRGE